MKILIPIDISTSSENAISYVTKLSDSLAPQELIFVANAHVTALEKFYPSPDFVYNAEARIEKLIEQQEQHFDTIRQRILSNLNTQNKNKIFDQPRSFD